MKCVLFTNMGPSFQFKKTFKKYWKCQGILLVWKGGNHGPVLTYFDNFKTVKFKEIKKN